MYHIPILNTPRLYQKRAEFLCKTVFCTKRPFLLIFNIVIEGDIQELEEDGRYISSSVLSSCVLIYCNGIRQG